MKQGTNVNDVNDFEAGACSAAYLAQPDACRS
jgi:hypothetical protein